MKRGGHQLLDHCAERRRPIGHDLDRLVMNSKCVLEEPSRGSGVAKQFLQPAFRSPDGAVFGPEQSAPTGASTTDQLAAFLGRKM